MNERIRAYILNFYVLNNPEPENWQALLVKYLNEQQTGDYNTRWQNLLALV